MNNEDPFEIGKRSMIDLLSQFELMSDLFNPEKHYALAIPWRHPSIVTRGGNALIFGLPPVKQDGSEIYLVGKGFKYLVKGAFPGRFDLVGRPCGMIDEFGLRITRYWLKELGIETPRMEEYKHKFGTKNFFFTVMQDLRENGKYKVEPAEKFPYDQLAKGNDLKESFTNSCERIVNECKRKDLIIYTAGHGSEEDPEPAIRHMFLVQYNSTGFGKLVPADLNHLLIHEKGHAFGIEPAYLKQSI